VNVVEALRDPQLFGALPALRDLGTWRIAGTLTRSIRGASAASNADARAGAGVSRGQQRDCCALHSAGLRACRDVSGVR